MNAIIVMLAAVTSWGCAGTFGGPQRESWWAPRDTSMEIAFAATAALTACDAAGTVSATNMGAYDRETRPGFVLGESNPVLQMVPGIGARPSVTAMVAAPAIATAASYLITRLPLPGWMRYGWLGVVAGVESYAVANNARWSGACGVAWTRYPG